MIPIISSPPHLPRKDWEAEMLTVRSGLIGNISSLYFSKFSKFFIVSYHCIQITHKKVIEKCEDTQRVTPPLLSSATCPKYQPCLSCFLGR